MIVHTYLLELSNNYVYRVMMLYSQVHAYICTKGGHNYKIIITWIQNRQILEARRWLVHTSTYVLNNQVNTYA